jgi:hypothetical protein
MEMSAEEFKVENPRKLSSWEEIAKREISRWLNDDQFKSKITRDVMQGEDMGPFTKFLYWFGLSCKAGWGVMVDFDDRKQRLYLPDHYYKWMHKLRDELLEVDERKGPEDPPDLPGQTIKVIG